MPPPASTYGAFAYARSIVALGETIAAFGLRRGVSRYLPIYEERGEPDRAAGTLVFALGAVLTLGLAVVLVVIGLRGVISGSVGSVTPSPDAVTMREHASFVELPDASTFQPRNDDPRAGYGILDVEARELRLVRVPYPVEEAQRKIIAAGLPGSLASRLAVGP